MARSRALDSVCAGQQRVSRLGATGCKTALARLGGWPLPRHLPTGPQLRALLAAPMSGQDFLKIVACATWLLWAVFAPSVIAEIAAAVRGRPALRLPGARPVQALAAALAGTAVLTAVAQASPLAAAQPAALIHEAPATPDLPAAGGLRRAGHRQRAPPVPTKPGTFAARPPGTTLTAPGPGTQHPGHARHHRRREPGASPGQARHGA
jgi:hypothetical protein